MADNKKRPVIERIREILAEIDRLLSPQPKPAPVPVPVRVREDRR
jgi:hypothetical protein